MDEPAEGAKAFEARLAALKRRMEAGLAERAQQLREAAVALSAGNADARNQLGSHGHRLRGIAGTYGYQALTDLAALLERASQAAPDDEVVRLAHELADLAEKIGRDANQLLSSPPMKPSVPQTSAAPRSQGPLRVLVIDDDTFVRRLLDRVLSDFAGFTVSAVATAMEGLLLLQSQVYDVVISDALMPDMNGRALCTAVRDLGGNCTTLPILILSAATAEELGWEELVDANMGWSCKPFQPDELVDTIIHLVERSRENSMP